MTKRFTRRLRRTAALPVLLALALAVAACGGDDQTAAPGGGGGQAATDGKIKSGLKITFLPKQINNPYFDVSDGGGEKAIKEFGGEYKQVGPSEGTASSQVTYINTAAQQRQDALVISANDANAVAPALKQAMSAGVKVVTYDSDAAPDARNLFVNQADSEEIGRSQVKLIAEQIGGEGEIAILSATPNATNQNAWIEFMKDELAKPENAKLKLVKVAYGNDDDEESFKQAQGLLQAYPNLKGIISPTTVGISAAARYLSGSSYKGKVKLTGLGTPNQMREFVKDGTVDAFALWDPAKLGYLAAYAAGALASDLISGKPGDKFTAGELGEYTVGQNSVVVLGPPTVFNKDNIDQFNF
jgi:rhamnose transport system substrate-binding protein